MGLAAYVHWTVLAWEFRPSSAVWERSSDLPQPGSSEVDQAFGVHVQLFVHSFSAFIECLLCAGYYAK